MFLYRQCNHTHWIWHVFASSIFIAAGLVFLLLSGQMNEYFEPSNSHNTAKKQPSLYSKQADGLEIRAPRYVRPRFFKRGQLKENAVVIFFHVPKTGGSTISHGLSQILTIQYLRPIGKKWSTYKDKIDQLCSTRPFLGNRIKTVVLEIHTLAPVFMNLQDQLQIWRVNAASNGIELFVFTNLREPVSWAVSAFNYHHRRVASLSILNGTNEALRQVSPNNPQCEFLLRSYKYKAAPEKRFSPKQEECNSVFNAMKTQMDFVGSTDHLKETTDILHFLLDLPKNFTFTHEKSAGQDKTLLPLRYEQLSDETIQYLCNISVLDYELYANSHEEWSVKMEGFVSRQRIHTLGRQGLLTC